MEIRSAVPADAGELSALIGELGYPGDPQQLRRTLVDLDGAAADAVLLAVDGQRLLGCISLHALPLFHRAGRLGRITAFVVASGQRGRGTGSVGHRQEFLGSAPAPRIAAQFHAAVASAFVSAAVLARRATGIQLVALSGGCMHNRRLVSLLRSGLEAEGFRVMQHVQVSPGDGGLSYGQAAVAAAILRSQR